jgi:ABC-type branched-subunit amino acid transport system substrate-binding protein
MRSVHKAVAVAAVLASALSLTACSSDSKSTNGGGTGASSSGGGSSKGGAYVIGATEDLSGKLAVYGKWAKESLTGYFNYVNAHGGVKGHKVTVKVLDDASDPARATANIRQLISEGALAVSGSTLSNICAAVEPLVSQQKIPEMCTAVPENLILPVHPYVFARLMPAETLATPIVSYISKVTTASKPKVAIITTTAADAVSFGSRVAREATAAGYDVVANKQVDASENANITGPAATIASAKADVVIGELAGPNNVTFIRALRAAGSKAPFISETADYGSMSTLKDAGYYQAWQRSVVDPTSSSPAVVQLVAAMQTVGISGEAAVNDGKIVEGYLAANAINVGLTNCGDPCTGEKLAAAMANAKSTLEGVGTNWGFTSAAHLPVSTVSIYKTDVATGRPVLAQADLPVGAISGS